MRPIDWAALMMGLAALIPALAAVPRGRSRRPLIGLSCLLAGLALVIGLVGSRAPLGPAPPQALPTSVTHVSKTTRPVPSTSSGPLTANDTPSIAGTWHGSYVCSQGETGLRLVIEGAAGGTLTAVFYFYPLPSNPDVPSGSFAMTGTYSAGDVILIQDYWIDQPPGYVMVNLSGTLQGENMFSGDITGASTAGCTTFSVEK